MAQNLGQAEFFHPESQRGRMEFEHSGCKSRGISSNLSRKDAKWHKGNENLFRVVRNPVRGAAERWPDFC
jgi:hypothetical protein